VRQQGTIGNTRIMEMLKVNDASEGAGDGRIIQCLHKKKPLSKFINVMSMLTRERT